MRIEIEEGKNNSLYAYENNELVFYSILKHNWFKQIISIFDSEDKLVVEIKSKMSFFSNQFEIVFQGESYNRKIHKISEYEIFFDQEKINCSKGDIFSFNLNKSYYLKSKVIAKTKQKMWTVKKKILLEISNEYVDFFEYIIIHSLMSNIIDK